MKALSSEYIFDGERLLSKKAILVENNTIIEICDLDALSDKTLLLDYGSGVLTAGFIDLQVNGCGGVLFNENISLATLEVMYQTCLLHGTTSFLPTLITTGFADVIKSLEIVKQWFDLYSDTRGVIGIHLEGPFISKNKAGIHPVEFIIRPEQTLIEQIVHYRQYFPIKMTIAVEEFEADQIRYLADKDIILAIGHSNASCAKTINSIKAGITAATHVFNAMSGLTARAPGVIGAVLNNNKVYAGLIADLIHVDSTNIELTHKLKADKVYLVTDAVTPTGTNIEEFCFAGKKLYVKDGKCLDEFGVIGGACLTMNEAVKNCVNDCAINLENALNMASYIPAQVMQFNHLGVLKPGARADIIHMNLADFACQICE